MIENSSAILFTGSSGYVGGFIASHFIPGVTVLTPSHHELDITRPNEVIDYCSRQKPSVIIHCAAFTDADAAERERGDKNGLCWQVNVEGTKNIVTGAETCGSYVIFISTGSVFSGDKDHPGPFTEDDVTSPEKKLSWYAWTKAVAETFVRGVVVRLSHPVSKPEIFDIPPQDTVEAPKPHPDYIQHFVQLFDARQLYPLFIDQQFPLTYLDDVVIAIKRLLETKKKGIFHVVSFDLATPYELAYVVIDKARHVQPDLPRTTFDDFIKTQKNPLRFSKYSAIDGKKTAADLQLPARTWREIVDCLYEIRKV